MKTVSRAYANRLRRLVYSALFLALALLLPFLTQIGSALSPMHIPVLLCGFVCGWPWGLAVGFIAPLLRHLLFGMPPILTAIAMAFELAAYGAFSGLFYGLLPRKAVHVYTSLIGAMLCGRAVWGAVSFLLYGLLGNPFTPQIFLAGAFLNAVPGILCQLILIPPAVLALQKAGFTAPVPAKKALRAEGSAV